MERFVTTRRIRGLAEVSQAGRALHGPEREALADQHEGIDMAIENIACVGAGLIGSSWASLFAWKGYDVWLQDVEQDALARAMENVRSNLGFLVEYGFLDKEKESAALQRVKGTVDLEEAVAECHYVQESVTECLPVKIDLFEKLDALTSPRAILASSTSTLAMTNIARNTHRPERCLVAHPWNPPCLVPLVELVPGARTSSETVEETRRLMESLDKVPVVQKKEAVGAIGNRITAAIWREAINIVLEGIADPEEVDKAMVAGPGFRLAVCGPFLTYHLGGGEGGIASYLEHIGPTMSERWKTLGAWEALSGKDEERLVGLVEQMEMVRAMSMGELVRRRDEGLADLLRMKKAIKEQMDEQ